MRTITPPGLEVTDDELEALIEEARQRARRRRLGLLAITIALGVAIAGALLLISTHDSSSEATGGSAEAGSNSDAESLYLRAFGATPGWHRDRLARFDTATGETKLLPISLGCGDTMFCLIPTGASIVIGSVDRTFAYEPGEGGKPRTKRIGDGWISLPSSTPGHVWTVSSGNHNRLDRTGRLAREIDLDGNVVRSVHLPQDRWPVEAVTDGVLVQGRHTLDLFVPGRRQAVDHAPGAFPADSIGDRVASCDEPCPQMIVTNFASGEVIRLTPPSGFRWLGGYDGEFSPDGTQLALPVTAWRAREGHQQNRFLAVADLESGSAALIPRGNELARIYGAMTWSRSGSELFFAGDDQAIMSFDLDAGTTSELGVIPMGSNGGIIEMVAGSQD